MERNRQLEILVNEKGQGQCPGCGTWNKLEVEHKDGLLHEFSCCSRNFVVAIDQENLKKFIEEGDEPPTPNDDWLFKK